MNGRGVRLKELKAENKFILDEEKPSLLEIVFKYLANNLHLICSENPITHNYELKPDVILPAEICNR
jgi:hypothetical protein